MPPVTIREAQPEDDPVVGELLVNAFITAYARKMPEVRYDEERKRELRDVAGKRSRATVLVAEQGGKVVGTVALFRPGAEGSEAWLPNAADLRHLAIDAALHGQGLSAPLLEAAEKIARNWRVEAICLHVRKGAHGVARLYQKRGWVREPAGDLHLPTVSLEGYLKRV